MIDIGKLVLNRNKVVFLVLNIILSNCGIVYANSNADIEKKVLDSKSDRFNNVRNHNLIKTKKIKIVFLPTYGNEKDVYIRGRVVKDDNVDQVKPFDGAFNNFIRSINLLTNEDIEGVKVKIYFNGKKIRAVTDDLGIFSVKVNDLGKIQTGYNEVTAELERGQVRFISNRAYGQITVKDSQKTDFAIVSDIDDTIQKSYVTDKFKAAQTLLFNNYMTQKAFPGVSELYQALDKNNDGIVNGDVYYISGSPVQISQRIENFLSYNGFPFGSIDLKRIGFSKNVDNPVQQMDYKLEKLRILFDTYPNKKFILFGDNGEKDPEIYREISRKYPNKVIAIYINNVTGDNKNSVRYNQVLLTDSAIEAANDLLNNGFIKNTDLEIIKGIVESNK